jgi:hypothetical protein
VARKSNFGNRSARKQVHFVYTCRAQGWLPARKKLSKCCGISAANPTKASHLPFFGGPIPAAGGRLGESGISLAYLTSTLLRVRLPHGYCKTFELVSKQKF